MLQLLWQKVSFSNLQPLWRWELVRRRYKIKSHDPTSVITSSDTTLNSYTPTFSQEKGTRPNLNFSCPTVLRIFISQDFFTRCSSIPVNEHTFIFHFFLITLIAPKPQHQCSQGNLVSTLLHTLIVTNNRHKLVYNTEKAMAPHSSTLAWKIPWMEEPDRLQSMGSLRVRHDWATSLSLFTFMHWRRKWQPTPVFLPGESQKRGSLVGSRLRGRTESDMTEAT